MHRKKLVRLYEDRKKNESRHTPVFTEIFDNMRLNLYRRVFKINFDTCSCGYFLIASLRVCQTLGTAVFHDASLDTGIPILKILGH